jgi:hypothetical protein
MKKKDQLTPFLAKSLLYDYLKGNLSSERKKAVDLVLQQDADLKLVLRNLEMKMKELESFDAVGVTERWKEDLSLPHPSLSQQLASLERRFAPRFWKALPLTVLVVSVITAVAVFQPWKLLHLNEVEVTQVAMNDDDVRMEAALALSEKDIENVMKAQVQETKEEAPSTDQLTLTGTRTAPPVEVKAKTPEKQETPPKQKPKMGELYRGFMTVGDLVAVSDKAASKIIALGGKKAGQVPLGWERAEDERYFHFSLPEKNKKALLDFLSNFSQVRLSSQPHPLVMPEGKIRIILVVRQDPNAERPAPRSEEPGQEETPPSEKEETSP